MTRLFHEPEDRYHARTDCMSSHRLATFRRSPALYHAEMTGEIDRPETDAMRFGRAAHCRILEGVEEYEDRYTVSDGPTNPRTGKPYGNDTKKHMEWRAEQTGEIVSTEDDLRIYKMNNEAIESHPTACELLTIGEPELVGRTECEGVTCQIRIDWLMPSTGSSAPKIVDLKTTKDIDQFEWVAKKFEYIHQLAFYRMIHREITGEQADIYIVAVETQAPFRCGVWEVCASSLAVAEDDNLRALVEYRDCAERGRFPTRYESNRFLSFS